MWLYGVVGRSCRLDSSWRGPLQAPFSLFIIVSVSFLVSVLVSVSVSLSVSVSVSVYASASRLSVSLSLFFSLSLCLSPSLSLSLEACIPPYPSSPHSPLFVWRLTLHRRTAGSVSYPRNKRQREGCRRRRSHLSRTLMLPPYPPHICRILRVYTFHRMSVPPFPRLTPPPPPRGIVRPIISGRDPSRRPGEAG